MAVSKVAVVIVMLVADVQALAAGAAKEPDPTWPWPGPTPPEIRDALVKKGTVFRPNERELKQIELIAPGKPAAAPAKPRKVLLWGRLWSHLCNPFTEETVKVLGKKTGAFEVVATDDPQMLLPEKLRDFDALFFNGLHDPNPFLPPWFKQMPKEQQAVARELDQKVKRSILKFVGEDGKGLAGIEGSICALRDWKEFGELMGAFYAGHYVGNFVVKADDPAHPLTSCFSGQTFKVFDQAYIPGPPYSRKNLRVLLSLDLSQTPEPIADPKMAWLKPSVQKLHKTTGRKEYPISWVKSYGRGRVFYVSLGVQRAPYSSPLFMRYLLAGIQFAIGDLPGETTPSEK